MFSAEFALNASVKIKGFLTKNPAKMPGFSSFC